jgi:hypothetical protein
LGIISAANKGWATYNPREIGAILYAVALPFHLRLQCEEIARPGADTLCGIAGVHRPPGTALWDERHGAHSRAFADRNPGQDHGSRPYRDVFTNGDRSSLYSLKLLRHSRVAEAPAGEVIDGGENARTLRQAGEVAEFDIPREPNKQAVAMCTLLPMRRGLLAAIKDVKPSILTESPMMMFERPMIVQFRATALPTPTREKPKALSSSLV